MSIKRQILEDTFTQPFNIERFVKFTTEFFNGPQILSPYKRNEKVWKEYRYYIDSYRHVAKYIDGKDKNILILAVQLRKGRSVERARSMQRNFISRLISDSKYDAAIVAFYCEDEPTWRLSFVRLDYEFTAKGVKLDLTPAKRYSYLVGEGEPSHTAQEQLLPIFERESYNPTLDEIEHAFSVETVTKDFFEKYREKYYDLKEYLDNNEAFKEEAQRHNFTSEQFAKKLMGQLVFLYFLQKKGWLGVKVLPENRQLTEEEFKKIFYRQNKAGKDVLLKIFPVCESGIRKVNTYNLSRLNDEEGEILAGCFKGTEHEKPWGSGTRTFIRDLFTHCVENTNKNFFDDFLEPLFYEALNKKRGENHYYPKFNCKIPFLNGGLFEPLDNYDWQHNDFNIPNEIFSNEKTKGREADGILDIFDRYNFTINEDEPLEREVAVDPEMLGKIFENLLDAKDRKSKGAFYTPREIVHYMCQESLINYLVNETGVSYQDIKNFILYGELMKDEDCSKDFEEGKKEQRIPKTVLENLLKIDNALKQVKVADPAVGSGAFPLGMLNEIVKARMNITEYLAREIPKENKYEKLLLRKNRHPYKIKWETIKNSIFAVDIESSAVDIAKLRLWLSLIVDQEIDEENTCPHPLPNLDCNIMCGNSLIDEFEGIKLFDESLLSKQEHSKDNTVESYQISLFQDQIEMLLEDLFKEQDRLFGEEDTAKKMEIKKNIDKIIDSIIRAKLSRDKNKEGLIKYEQSLKEKTKPYFLWKLEFAKIFKEKGGFDIVIGNPPYVGEEGHKELFRALANTAFGEKYYKGKMDLWYFFTSKGIELLRSRGVLSYIAPNNWMTTAGGSKMRQHIMNEMTIKRFITFKDFMVFENASQQTMVFILQKSADDEQYSFQYSEIQGDYNSTNYVKDFLVNQKIGIHFITQINRENCRNGETIQFLNNSIAKLIAKIKKNNAIYLEDYEIINGIHPHHACVTKKMLPLLTDSVVGDGIFIISQNELDKLNLTNKEKELIKPYYDSTNIDRYYFDKNNNKWIIYTTSEFKDIRKMDDYPNLKKHLDKYISVITSDNRPYGLHRARKQEFFEFEKIVSLRKCKVPTFMYIAEPSYVTAEYNVIRTQRIDMLFLLGILNSKLVAFWLKNMGKIQGNIYQVDKEPLVNIPITIPSEETKKEIVNLTKEIIEKKRNNEKTSSLESSLDAVVYKLYNLSQEDIDIIEDA